jgi:hypothetical protein
VSTAREKLLKRIAAAILVVGLASAVWIYVAAGPAAEDPLGRDDSKAYQRNMELYGGQANVLAFQLMTWFQGLWHGRSLAYTVGVLTLLTAGAVALAAAAQE